MNRSWNKFLTEGELKTVGIVVCLNDEQQFLIIRRSNIDHREGQWTLPGGHIDDEDDSIEAGAIRELYEEANLKCELSNLQYLGQTSKNKYYYLTTKWSGKANVDKPNPHTGQVEHDEYKWATINKIKEIEDTTIPIYLLEKALELSKKE